MICCLKTEEEEPLFPRQAVRVPADFGERKKYSECHLFPEWGRGGAWGFPQLRQPDPDSESKTAAPWIILGSGSTLRHPGLRGISRHSEAVCTPNLCLPAPSQALDLFQCSPL